MKREEEERNETKRRKFKLLVQMKRITQRDDGRRERERLSRIATTTTLTPLYCRFVFRSNRNFDTNKMRPTVNEDENRTTRHDAQHENDERFSYRPTQHCRHNDSAHERDGTK